MTIGVVDTSVFCNILHVPGRSQHSDRAVSELEEYVSSEYSLLLPLATIYESGNHIAQAANGDRRRQVAKRFCTHVRAACTGEAYWSPTPIHAGDDLVEWLSDFPDQAMRGVGMADLSIVKIFEEQCRLHPGRRVFIWSYDDDLLGYDREP